LKKIISILVFLGLCWGAAQAYIVKDVRGKPLSFSNPPQRIITLLPNLTEIACNLGLESRLVGVTSRCNYPPSVLNKPKIGDFYLDYEKVLFLKPDLVVVEEGMRTQQVNKLEKLGLKVAVVNSKDLQGFYQTLKILGKITGTEERAKALEQNFKQTLQSFAQKSARIPEAAKPKVFIEIELMPTIRTVGSSNFINDLIVSAGGKNIFAFLKEPYPVVNLESLVKFNPDIIILTTVKPATLYAKSSWQGIAALKNKRVYYLDPDLLVRPGMRLLQGLEKLNRFFYLEAAR
jgi:iron complex transport system substrate-binding protein